MLIWFRQLPLPLHSQFLSWECLCLHEPKPLFLGSAASDAMFTPVCVSLTLSERLR